MDIVQLEPSNNHVAASLVTGRAPIVSTPNMKVLPPRPVRLNAKRKVGELQWNCYGSHKLHLSGLDLRSVKAHDLYWLYRALRGIRAS